MVLASRLEQLVEELRKTDPNSDLLAALTQVWIKLKYHAQTATSQAIAAILDPRYILQTFRNLSWREVWIIEARTSFVQTYNDQYAPILADSHRPPTLDPFESDGLEDDFLLAVFGSQFIMYLRSLRYIWKCRLRAARYIFLWFYCGIYSNPIKISRSIQLSGGAFMPQSFHIYLFWHETYLQFLQPVFLRNECFQLLVGFSLSVEAP